MNHSLQVVVAVDDEIDRGLVEAIIARNPDVAVIDYLPVGGSTASGYGSGDILIVACAEYTDQVGEYTAEAARQHPRRPVVLLSPLSGNGYLGDVFSHGVDDVVGLPDHVEPELEPDLASQLFFALEKAVARRRNVDHGAPTGAGRLICVLGLKGGSGKTLTTANLGVALAEKGRRVALVDLDLQFGDLALALGVPPERTIHDLIQSGGSLDAEKLGDFLVEHSSGARALLAPLRPDQAGEVTVPLVREVLRLLRDTHEFVLVDTPPNFTPEVISAVDGSSDVLMVSMRDTLALKNTKLGLETLDRMEYDRRNVRIVLNRANTNVGIAHEDVVAILGREADILVPSHRDITRSVNQGRPIASQRGAAAGKAFRALAELYASTDLAEEPTEVSIAPAREARPTPPVAPRRRSVFGRAR
jgi:pilus assembly protein CpaE